MSKKSLLSLPSKAQLGNFNAMTCLLSNLHFEEFPFERRRLELVAMGLTPPENERQEEAVQGVSFRKYFQDGYFDRVERLTDRVHALVYLLNIAMLNRPYSKIDGTIMPH